MFREMRRKNQALSGEECVRVLTEERRGVLSVLGDDGYPYGMPLNHWYDPAEGRLYFHGGKVGQRVDAVKKHDKVSYCVYDKGTPREGDWALYVRSVVIFGRLHPVEDRELAMDVCRRLCYKFTADEEYISNEILQHGEKTLVYELIPEHMTGKLVKES
ncbi:MAG: pyridoxamine 5'-phosphate oxidase family protein [Clostridia bacterium]|nr:pyridoxamine 5'-phosphate oxidase family protein [Clostridia bacterium]